MVVRRGLPLSLLAYKKIKGDFVVGLTLVGIKRRFPSGNSPVHRCWNPLSRVDLPDPDPIETVQGSSFPSLDGTRLPGDAGSPLAGRRRAIPAHRVLSGSQAKVGGGDGPRGPSRARTEDPAPRRPDLRRERLVGRREVAPPRLFASRSGSPVVFIVRTVSACVFQLERLKLISRTTPTAIPSRDAGSLWTADETGLAGRGTPPSTEGWSRDRGPRGLRPRREGRGPGSPGWSWDSSRGGSFLSLGSPVRRRWGDPRLRDLLRRALRTLRFLRVWTTSLHGPARR